MATESNPTFQEVLARKMDFFKKYKDQNDRIGKIYRYKRSLDIFLGKSIEIKDRGQTLCFITPPYRTVCQKLYASPLKVDFVYRPNPNLLQTPSYFMNDEWDRSEYTFDSPIGRCLGHSWQGPFSFSRNTPFGQCLGHSWQGFFFSQNICPFCKLLCLFLFTAQPNLLQAPSYFMGSSTLSEWWV